MAKDRRTREQKRKAKLTKRSKSFPKSSSLAYTGDKYKKDELIPLLMKAEIGIYESYVMTNRELLDQTVASALQKLIKQMRSGKLPALDSMGDMIIQEDSQGADLVTINIRRGWELYFEEKWKPPLEQRIGVLRTVLGSLETMRSPSLHSQSYLRYIQGFLTKNLGVQVQMVTEEMVTLPEPEEGELVLTGRQWVFENDLDAKAGFFSIAEELIEDGQAGDVIDACNALLGEEGNSSSENATFLIQLTTLARESLSPTMKKVGRD